MAFPRKHFKKAPGAQIAALTQRVYICQACHQMQPFTKKRPEECSSCGALAFDTFDSAGECGRWHSLLLLVRAGEITDLRRQVSYDLLAARIIEGRTVGVKVGKYIADFVYTEKGETVIEDYKGSAMTDLASWKLRHMEAQGLPVKLVSG